MTTVYAPPVLVFSAPIMDTLRFRVLRDGAVTPGVKYVRVVRNFNNTGKGEIAQEALGGEFTPYVSVLRQELVDQPEWVVYAEDATPPARVHAQYIAIPGAGTYTIDIGESFPRHLLLGDGYLAGQVNAPSPVNARVRVLYRASGTASPGDGLLVADVATDASGVWLVDGLNPSLRFDVVARRDDYNDVITANVQPVASGG